MCSVMCHSSCTWGNMTEILFWPRCLHINSDLLSRAQYIGITSMSYVWGTWSWGSRKVKKLRISTGMCMADLLDEALRQCLHGTHTTKAHFIGSDLLSTVSENRFQWSRLKLMSLRSITLQKPSNWKAAIGGLWSCTHPVDSKTRENRRQACILFYTGGLTFLPLHNDKAMHTHKS